MDPPASVLMNYLTVATGEDESEFVTGDTSSEDEDAVVDPLTGHVVASGKYQNVVDVYVSTMFWSFSRYF